MKKILLGSILLIIITGVAFAEFPDDQLGIGIAGRFGCMESTYQLGGLSAKFPYVPIFSAFTFNNNSMSMILDYYILNPPINRNINLDWYLGAGGEMWTMYKFDGNGFLARVPVGISWRYLSFDFFAEAAIKLGIKFIEDPATEKMEPEFDRNLDIMIGVRFWL